MKEIVQGVKKVGLFLFGTVLIVWGYKANASEAKSDESPKDLAKEQNPIVIPDANSGEEVEREDTPVKEELPVTTSAAKPATPTQKESTKKKEVPVKAAETKSESKPAEKEKVQQQTVVETAGAEESSGTE